MNCLRQGGSALLRWVQRAGARALTGEAAVHEFDVVVVGGGVMGSWAAAQVAARGVSCALLDQFEPGHDKGSSHGDGRIYRFAYEEDIYVDMMELSLKHWTKLQDFAGEPIMATTGGVNLGPVSVKGTAQDHLTTLQKLYERRGYRYQRLSSSGLNELFPQFKIPESYEALYQPEMGVLFATKAVRATWRYAESLGAQLFPGSAIESLQADAGGSSSSTSPGSGLVVVKTANGKSFRSKSVILAPGSWISQLGSKLLGLEIPTKVSAETVSYYAPKPGCTLDHTYRSAPVFMSNFDNGVGQFGYYGLPAIDIPGVKVSAHYAGPNVDPSRRPASAGGSGASKEEEEVTRARVEEIIASNGRFVASHFPFLEAEPLMSHNCLYTRTPDHDYIIGKAPNWSQVVLAGGGSGHAFKMGPAIGEACACLALGLEPPYPLEKFKVERLLGRPFESTGSLRK